MVAAYAALMALVAWFSATFAPVRFPGYGTGPGRIDDGIAGRRRDGTLTPVIAGGSGFPVELDLPGATLGTIVFLDTDGLYKTMRQGAVVGTFSADPAVVLTAAIAAYGVVSIYQDMPCQTKVTIVSKGGIVGVGPSLSGPTNLFPTVSAAATFAPSTDALLAFAGGQTLCYLANLTVNAKVGAVQAAARAGGFAGDSMWMSNVVFTGGNDATASGGSLTIAGSSSTLVNVGANAGSGNACFINGADGEWNGGYIQGPPAGFNALLYGAGSDGWTFTGVHFICPNGGPALASKGTRPTYNGCYFDNSNATANVSISTSNDVAIFNGCKFRINSNSAGGFTIISLSAGHALFVGCQSNGGPAAPAWSQLAVISASSVAYFLGGDYRNLTDGTFATNLTGAGAKDAFLIGVMLNGTPITALRPRVTGTPHVAGDYTLSAGWGSTATVSAVAAVDAGGRVTIAATGVGQGAGPTVVLTFKDLAWLSAPGVSWSVRGDANAPTTADWAVTAVSTTSITFTFLGIPVAGTSYVLAFGCSQ